MPSIRSKLNVFLESFDHNQSLKKFDGLCTGLAFMNFRADVLGESNKNTQRMHSILTTSDAELRKLGYLLSEYLNARNSLIKSKGVHANLDIMNNDLFNIYHQLHELHNFRNNLLIEQTNINIQIQIDICESRIVKLRRQRDCLIEAILLNQFGSEKIKQINHAQELYYYLYTLLTANDPGRYLNYHYENNYVNQCDFVEIFDLLAPQIFLKHKQEINNVIAKSFEIAFLFTKSELIELFDDYFNSKFISEYIILNSIDHTVYLSHHHGQFKLYDPEPTEINPRTAEEVAFEIEKCFYTDFNYSSFYMPIRIQAYRKKTSNQPGKKIDAGLVVRNILKKRANMDINARAWEGSTAISFAASEGYPYIVGELIRHGADPDIADDDGWTPAHFAGRYGHAKVIKVLIDAKADLNKANKDGWTPAQIAERYGHADVIKAMTDARIDSDKPDNDALTPAHVAERKDRTNTRFFLHAKKLHDLSFEESRQYNPS